MSLDPIQPDWTRSGAHWIDLWDATPRDRLCTALVLPEVGVTIDQDAAMFIACAMALRGSGSVSPNPLVGAVVVDKHHKFLAAGAHLRVGEAHAEVNAFSSLERDAVTDGGTLYVTLEPCAHEGRTPSCAKMICKTDLSRVVYGVMDPFSRVDGKGLDILRSCGKVVECMDRWRSRCEWIARVFLQNQRLGSVYTGIKVASTTGGVVAGDSTSRLWITGERARQMGHFLRLEYDAILIGPNTLHLDDPTLNVRHPMISGRTPLRVVLDPCDEIRGSNRAYKLISEEPGSTLVVLPESASPLGLGVREVRVRLGSDGLFQLSDIKSALWSLGVRSLLIEGGASVWKSALEQNAVDAIHWFAAADRGQQGLKWDILPELLSAYNRGGGVQLGSDRLIEIEL